MIAREVKQRNPRAPRYSTKTNGSRRFGLRKFGLSEEDYADMLRDQDGRCAICQTADPGGNRSFAVDHDHETGNVRGLLCTNCNIGLGCFRDNANYLLAAVGYLHEPPVLRLVPPAVDEASLPLCEQLGGCESCGAESDDRLCDSCVVLGVDLDVAPGHCHGCGRQCGGIVCAVCSSRRYRLTHAPVVA